jgi:hypothetical protein
MARTGWERFTVWTFAGTFFFFALASGFSIGLFLLPFALIALWLVARRGRIWPEVFGVAAGAGLIGLLIASMSSSEDAMPWLIAGFGLIAAASLAYALARRGIAETP